MGSTDKKGDPDTKGRPAAGAAGEGDASGKEAQDVCDFDQEETERGGSGSVQSSSRINEDDGGSGS
jgi:hypothetical protein